MAKDFKVLSINISDKKGQQKRPVAQVELREEHGIVGDAHAGPWHRQISLLANEDITTMRGRGIELSYGDFAENITTEGVDLACLPLGTKLVLGEAELELTQIGKACHHGCAIYEVVGDCVMPRRGVFARVLRGAVVSSDSRCYVQQPPLAPAE
jgi:MOSC domain-containing protein YiiM